MPASQQQILRPRIACILVCGLLAAFSSPAFAVMQQIPVPAPDGSPRRAEQIKPEKKKDTKGKKEAVTVGFSLLILVSLVGVTLAFAVMIWGARLRRMTRSQPSKRSAEDPLWYLKPEKKSIQAKSLESETPHPDNSDREAT